MEAKGTKKKNIPPSGFHLASDEDEKIILL
jgi:hypothetical protein